MDLPSIKGVEPEDIAKIICGTRIEKAKKEIGRNQEFDTIILNDDFLIACKETMEVVKKFIG